MKVVSSDEMRRIEAYAFDKLGVPSVVLMENAALGVLKRVKKYIRADSLVTVVIGPGNNGGDGWALCRHIFSLGLTPQIVFLGREENIKNDALVNFRIIKNIPLDYYTVNGNVSESVKELILGSDLIIDAIFGIGLTREVSGFYAEVIDIINESEAKVLAVDIPSGVDSDSGQVLGTAVRAYETITFGYIKSGLVLYPGFLHCGRLILSNISLPENIHETFSLKKEIFTDSEIRGILPKRKTRSNKGSFGKIFVFAGSSDMTGAAFLSASSAYKTGAGLVFGCFVQDVKNVVQIKLPEAVYKTVAEKNGFLCKESFAEISADLKNADVIIFGPGVGKNHTTKEFAKELFENAKVPMVLDADALNILAEDLSLLEKIKVPVVLTPHPAEMSRLTGLSVAEILANPEKTASEFAAENNLVLLLKDTRTIIADPKGHIFINTTGCNAMAKGGSGDVLTGIIAGFIAQGMDIFEAAKLGAYIHGTAGEIAAEKLSAYGVTAGDLINFIPKTLRKFSANKKIRKI